MTDAANSVDKIQNIVLALQSIDEGRKYKIALLYQLNIHLRRANNKKYISHITSFIKNNGCKLLHDCLNDEIHSINVDSNIDVLLDIISVFDRAYKKYLTEAQIIQVLMKNLQTYDIQSETFDNILSTIFNIVMPFVDQLEYAKKNENPINHIDKALLKYLIQGNIRNCLEKKLAYYKSITSKSKRIKHRALEREIISWLNLLPTIYIDTNNPIINTDDYSEIYCPINMNIMIDPVVTISGSVYDRHSIYMWLLEHDTDPLTNKPLVGFDKVLIPCHSLRNLIAKICEK